MKRKGLAVVVILLFIGMYVVPSTAVTELEENQSPISFEGDTLYVGGSGPNNYTKIQDAIDNSNNSDTIFVYNGVYNDYYPDGQYGYTVNINKEIKLLGEDKNHTILNGTGNAITVRVSSNNVEIRNFTIQNGGASFGGGIRIMDGKKGTSVFYNIIKNNNVGIFMMFNSNVLIRYNLIENNGNGIFLFDSYNTKIWTNIIANNTNGIVMTYGQNFIGNVEFRDNKKGIQTDNTQINGGYNNFIKNDKHIESVKGVYLSSFLLYYKMRNYWVGNYWDDLGDHRFKAIKGRGVIYIDFLRVDIPILLLPYIEFDFHPRSTPIDIRSFFINIKVVIN